MSFGLLTAVEPADIPRIMRRVAEQYRGVQTKRYKRAWDVAADMLDRCANELEPVVNEIVRSEPRPRIRLDDPEDVVMAARERRRRRRLERKQRR
jgi:hypothetical protein